MEKEFAKVLCASFGERWNGHATASRRGVVPASLGLGVYGPFLDTKGNSVAGVALLTELSERSGLYLL